MRSSIVSVLFTSVNITLALVKFDLVGVAEVALMLGVSRQRVHAIMKTHEDFPQPVADLSAGRIWLREDVERWARRSGRSGK